jgi:hypothetical protein
MEADSSFIRAIDPCDEVEEGGLSCSIRTDQSYNLSILHVKGDIREHSESAKMECDPFYFKKLRGLNNLYLKIEF